MSNIKAKKILVAMSGGVDSSVAAKLLIDAGYDVTGVFLYFWKDEAACGVENKCCSTRSLMDARKVCRQLGVKLITMNFSDVFKREIVDNFVSEYEVGRTPNPCVRCNKFVKLGLLIKRARQLGFDGVASGHYANIKYQIANNKFVGHSFDGGSGQIVSSKYQVVSSEEELSKMKKRNKKQDIGNRGLENSNKQSSCHSERSAAESKNLLSSNVCSVEMIEKSEKLEVGNRKLGVDEVGLCKGIDQRKDQSYFLYKLSREDLGYLILPLGGFEKSEVRRIAEEAGLVVASKQDSQEICFVGRDHNEFLGRHLDLQKGEIRTLDDGVVGEHKGLPLYTLGQRKGIEIGGVGPFYVVRKDQINNVLYVSNNPSDETLFDNDFEITDANWLVSDLKFPYKTTVAIRYGAQNLECEIFQIDKDKYRVKLNEKVRAITSGQSAVFYDGDRVVGGGVIS